MCIKSHCRVSCFARITLHWQQTPLFGEAQISVGSSCWSTDWERECQYFGFRSTQGNSNRLWNVMDTQPIPRSIYRHIWISIAYHCWFSVGYIWAYTHSILVFVNVLVIEFLRWGEFIWGRAASPCAAWGPPCVGSPCRSGRIRMVWIPCVSGCALWGWNSGWRLSRTLGIYAAFPLQKNKKNKINHDQSSAFLYIFAINAQTREGHF